jgi:hypothetical protein
MTAVHSPRRHYLATPNVGGLSQTVTGNRWMCERVGDYLQEALRAATRTFGLPLVHLYTSNTAPATSTHPNLLSSNESTS